MSGYIVRGKRFQVSDKIELVFLANGHIMLIEDDSNVVLKIKANRENHDYWVPFPFSDLSYLTVTSPSGEPSYIRKVIGLHLITLGNYYFRAGFDPNDNVWVLDETSFGTIE